MLMFAALDGSANYLAGPAFAIVNNPHLQRRARAGLLLGEQVPAVGLACRLRLRRV